MDTKPSNKTSIEVIAGSLVTVLVWIVTELGLEVPEYVVAAVTTIVIGAIAYFLPAKSGKYVDIDQTPVSVDYQPKH